MQNHTTAPTAHNDNEQIRGTNMGYRLDVTSHVSAHLNRVFIEGTFKFLQGQDISKEESIQLMRKTKDRIRRDDAEPAAWAFRPDRYDWVQQRRKNGEQMTDERLGRALQGKEEQ